MKPYRLMHLCVLLTIASLLVAPTAVACQKGWHIVGVCPFCIPWKGCSSSASAPPPPQATNYPVGWMPYIIDLTKWRNYDPSTIDGVGVLMGQSAGGRLYGYQLKSKQSEYLSSGEYIYVYQYKKNIDVPNAPNQRVILYRKSDLKDKSNYIRHSQLGAGKPVYCAGTFKLYVSTIFNELTEMTDASGHYKPVGSQCLKGVEAELRNLRIDTDGVQYKFRGMSVEDPAPRTFGELALHVSEDSLYRTLLAGGWRNVSELSTMSVSDRRNTLIVVLNQNSTDTIPSLQAQDDQSLIAHGLLYLWLKNNQVRTPAELSAMSLDNQRNTVIVEINKRTGTPISTLQAKSNGELVDELYYNPKLTPVPTVADTRTK